MSQALAHRPRLSVLGDWGRATNPDSFSLGTWFRKSAAQRLGVRGGRAADGHLALRQ